MWPRAVEVMLACWLAMSPFIFGFWPGDPKPSWIHWGVALAVAFISLTSCWKTFRKLYLLNLLIALGLVAYGWFGGSHPRPPGLQNDILTGLLLAMFAVIPTEAVLPPPAWRKQAPG